MDSPIQYILYMYNNVKLTSNGIKMQGASAPKSFELLLPFTHSKNERGVKLHVGVVSVHVIQMSDELAACVWCF